MLYLVRQLDAVVVLDTVLALFKELEDLSADSGPSILLCVIITGSKELTLRLRNRVEQLAVVGCLLRNGTCVVRHSGIPGLHGIPGLQGKVGQGGVTTGVHCVVQLLNHRHPNIHENRGFSNGL